MFAATNIQSAEVSTAAQATPEATPTQQLYAAIDALNLEAVQEILTAHPEEANKTSETKRGNNTSPLLFILKKYQQLEQKKYRSRQDFDHANQSCNFEAQLATNTETLNQITTALLNAGANPSKVVKYSTDEEDQNWSTRRELRSPLTSACAYQTKDFLKAILSHQYPEGHPFMINQIDGERQTALYLFTMKTCFISPMSDKVPANFMDNGLEIIKLFLLAGAKIHAENQNERLQTPMRLTNKFSESFAKFFNLEYYYYGTFFYDHSMSQIYAINAKKRIIKAMFEVNKTAKTQNEYADAIDAAAQAAIAQEAIISANRSKKFRNIAIASIIAPVLAFACKKYNIHTFVASAAQHAGQFVSNQLAPWMRTAITQAQ
jgi:hypothetical protein